MLDHIRGPFATILAVVMLIGSSRADIVITEVMYDPSGDDGWGGVVPTGNTEYIEILNTGPGNVNIMGYVLDDMQGELGTCTVSNDDFILAPGEFAVLIVEDTPAGTAPDPQNYKDAWGIPDPPAAEIITLVGYNKENSRQINNSASDMPLQLFTDAGRGTLVDAAEYPDASGQGEAVYICTVPLPTTADNDAGAPWLTFDSAFDPIPAPGMYVNGAGDTANFGAADAGTPGRANITAMCPCNDLVRIRSVAAQGAAPAPGQGATSVRVAVENLTPMILTVTSLALILQDAMATDVTGEYTITPDPGNPVVLPAASSSFFLFSVDPTGLVTFADISLDAVIDVDDGMGCLWQDLGSDSTDLWTVIDCGPGSSLCGECDGDGAVSIVDALVAALAGVGLTVLNPLYASSCDVNEDSAHSSTDALYIAQFVVGIRYPLNCCSTAGGLGLTPGIGDVVIAELMPTPALPILDADGEWFEIRNVSGILLDYAGLTVRVDASSTTLPGAPSLPVPGGAGFIVGRNGALVANGGALVNHVWCGFDLVDGGATVSVEMGMTVLHQVVYGAGWPHSNGVSAQLDPSITAPMDAQMVGNWCAAEHAYGVAGRGTPSSLNLTCNLVPPGCGVAPVPCADITLNEVNPDSFGLGGDVTEFVELHNPTGGTVDLVTSGYVLAFFDGTTDTSYLAVDLGTGAAGPLLEEDCFYLVGSAGVDAFFSLPAGTTQIILPDDTMQDGADAIALYKGAGCTAASIPNGSPAVLSFGACTLVDAVVYDNGQADDAGLLGGLAQVEQINESGGTSAFGQFDSIMRITDSQGCPTGISGNYIVTMPMTGGSEN